MQPRVDSSKVWTIILAAGDGTRLRPLTRALHGEDMPKQFAAIRGAGSLLQLTLARARAWSRPEHILVVVAAERAALAEYQLAGSDAPQLVLQPKNVGTGPGILLPLAHVLARDPEAQVVILPSDHHVSDEAAFRASIREATAGARAAEAVVLVGAVPDSAETEYGWITTLLDPTSASDPVTSFVEKPVSMVAKRLFAAGALWNTFIMAGAARRFQALAEQHITQHAALFSRFRRLIGTGLETTALALLYGKLASSDFSRDVLQRSSALRAVPLAPCGWSDWGTPRRVFNSLRGLGEFAALSCRLQASELNALDTGLPLGTYGEKGGSRLYC